MITRHSSLLLAVFAVVLTTCSQSYGQNAPSSGPQELDFGKGNAIPMAAVKSEATAPIQFNTAREFQLRLKSGGTVIVSESDLTTGDPNYQKRGLQFMALDVLELKKGARIVTGGNDLVIFANKIISEDGSIVAFTDKTKKAANATETGGAGNPGVSGGSVTLIAINGVDGRLNVDLSGQNGGNGSKGATGSTGTNGGRGTNASSGAGCYEAGGNGGDGGPGSKGATGGPSGNGGSGGSFFLYNIGDQPIPAADWDYIATPGNPGSVGAGGTGGSGGNGGEGGSGSGFCGGGNPGRHGGNGPDGDPGPNGITGSKGTSLVKNMDLELIIKTVKEIPLNTQPH